MSGVVADASAARDEKRLRHEGIPYSGPSAVVPLAAALIADSLRAGDACLFLAAPDTITGVRSALGVTGRRASYLDMSIQGRNPARVLPAMQSFLAVHRDQHVRFVTDPVPPQLSSAARAEVEFGELALGLADYRGWPASVLCLYDTESLPGDAAASFAGCHRHALSCDDAEFLLAERFAEPLPLAPSRAQRVIADLTTLSGLRRSVAQFGAGEGLESERVDDFVYAVNEVVTNSICHGEGRARVLLWSTDDEVVCEVFDRGRIADPMVGRRPPGPGHAGGRGLWLVNQLCDLVQVRSSVGGTTVRMSVDR